MVVKEINNSNYEAFTNLDLVAFSYAYEGAMGEGGGIYMIDASGQVYHANYYYGDLQEEHVKDILPMIEDIDFGLMGCVSRNEDWKFVYLGYGNNLFLKKDIFDAFAKIVEEAHFHSVADLYVQWPGIVMEVTGKGDPQLTVRDLLGVIGGGVPPPRNDEKHERRV